MAYKVVNPSAGNVYFNNAGAASQSTANRLPSGVAKGLGANAGTMSNSSHGLAAKGEFGSSPVSGIAGEPATTAGTFANQQAGEYTMKKVGSDLANAGTNNTLRSGGAEFAPRRSTHRIMNAMRTTLVATAIRDGEWVVFSGVYFPAAAANNASIGDVGGSTVTDGSADHEANLTRSNQGSFSYRDGSPTPASGDYSSKLG